MDPRIIQYRDAALAMMRGNFNVELPMEPGDEVSQLGAALVDLGHTLEKKFQEINTLAEVTEKINAGLILDDVLSHVFDMFRPIIPYDRIGFSLLDEDGAVLRARWARADYEEFHLTPGYSAKLVGSSLQRILRSGQPRILNDLEDYLSRHPDSEATRLIVAEGVRSSLTCPLIALGKPIGFMFFSSREKGTYAYSHVQLFKQIAGQLSVIVEKGRLYQQLVELNELKNKFLGVAAHDLRSPISVLKGYLGLFLSGTLGELPGQHREFLHSMNKTCVGMLDLINNLLDVSAIEAGKLDLRLMEIELEPYLREFHASHTLLARQKGIELALELAPGLPSVVWDPNRIGQVIANLVTNAIKFSHPATTITLRARAAGDGMIELAVADQGQGIPESELPKMFTDFGRTSVRPTGGEKSTGLGLAIVKRMVEAHKGSIRVESKVGEGSTFIVTIPAMAMLE